MATTQIKLAPGQIVMVEILAGSDGQTIINFCSEGDETSLAVKPADPVTGTRYLTVQELIPVVEAKFGKKYSPSGISCALQRNKCPPVGKRNGVYLFDEQVALASLDVHIKRTHENRCAAGLLAAQKRFELQSTLKEM